MAKLFWLVALATGCLFALNAKPQHFAAAAAADEKVASEEENLLFIEKTLDMLNNRIECQLPSYAQIEELKLSFDELEQLYGGKEALESKLSADQKLVRETVLDQWDSFQKRMTGVVIRSAKKRSFLCKVERYQKQKFGESVCTRIKENLGPISDKIFEKNPIVRYIKHLETHEVIERPEQEVAQHEPLLEPKLSEEEARLEPKAQPAELERPEVAGGTIVTPLPDIQIEVVPAPVQEDDDKSVRRTLIGTFTVDYTGEQPRSFQVNINPPKSTPKEEDAKEKIDNENGDVEDEEEKKRKEEEEEKVEAERDPLDDIPVPSADDDQNEQFASADEKPNTEAEPTTTQTPPTTTEEVPVEQEEEVEPEPTSTTTTTTTTTTPEPLFDENGAEFINAEEDDADLDRLARVKRETWEFDPDFSYFKWPEESRNKKEVSTVVLDDSVRTSWAEFLKDPHGYDKKLFEEEEAAKRKFDPVEARLRRKEYLSQLANEARYETAKSRLGWSQATVPESTVKTVPRRNRAKPERWSTIADNSFCRMSYNKGKIVDSTKSGFRAVKSLFKRKDMLS